MSAQSRRRRLEVEDIGDATVVHFTDRKILDEQNIQIIGEQLFSLVDELGRRKLLLNFGNVEYLSSAALRKLVTLNKKLNAVGGQLILCNLAPQIYDILVITKLDKLFSIQRAKRDDDPPADPGGVGSRLKPPQPSGGHSAALRPPPPESEG